MKMDKGFEDTEIEKKKFYRNHTPILWRRCRY